MRLPGNEIGISDIKAFRDCGRRWAYGMRRHTEGAEPPEDVHPDTMYGQIFHETVHEIAKGISDAEALQRAFATFAAYLGPEDLDKLQGDLETYHRRDEIGVRMVANEKEIRAPLFEWCWDCEKAWGSPGCGDCAGPTETIYFRAKIDRLYQRLDNGAVFIHRDYKSSKWRRTEEEVHKDEQFWAYNWLIHEYWPECESLTQVYDQLRYGEIPTRKSDEQRAQIKVWLIQQVAAILRAEEPEPRFNEWCPWCPIKESCPVIDRLSEWSLTRISALMPEGSLDGAVPLEEHSERLGDVTKAIKTLEAYADSVKGLLKELPEDLRAEHGYKLRPKNVTSFEPAATEEIHRALGDEAFYRLAKLTKKGLEGYLEDDDRADAIMGLATTTAGTPALVKL